MPDISQMFPSTFLQADDLAKGSNTIVTIERITPASAKARGGEDPELKWMIRFREFRKAMSLWRSTAKTIAEVLGSSNTDLWVGQQIAIYPSTYTSFGEIKPCINVDKWRPEQVNKPGTPSTSLVVLHDKRPIPKEAMTRFLGHIKEQGKGWEDFLRWGKTADPAILTLAWGVDLDAIPAGCLPAMKAYLDSLTAPKELINARTGEVIPYVDQVRDDDIPF